MPLATGTRYGKLATRNPATLEPQNADATPAVAVTRNGVTVAPTVTVSNGATGQYAYSYALPSGTADGDEFVETWTWAVDAVQRVRVRQFTAHVSPDNAGIAAIKDKTDNLPADPASEGTAQSAATQAGQAKDAVAALSIPDPLPDELLTKLQALSVDDDGRVRTSNPAIVGGGVSVEMSTIEGS